MREDSLNPPKFTIGQKLLNIHWFFVFLICLTVVIGIAMLYSAANGSFQPWASRQLVRFGVGFLAMIAVALIDVRI
ncbi:MAG: rod shape-determining protein RodA, partial [Rhodospirillales bacterium]|nr:rod shape-determining protein RodA [Rhodospirillales bacterium]